MKEPAEEAAVTEGEAEVEAEEGEDSEVEVAVVAVVDTGVMMGLVTDAVIKAKGRVTKETTKMIEIRDQDHHEATGVDQGVTLHVAQMTIIRMEMTAETTDAVIIAMIVQMSSEMGMTQTVHPDVSDHDDSDQEPQGRIVTLKREVKALKVVATTKRSMVTTLPLLKRPTKYTTNMRYSSVLGCILTNSLAARFH